MVRKKKSKLNRRIAMAKWTIFKQVSKYVHSSQLEIPHVPWSKVAILGMVIPPLIGILIIGI